MVRGVNLRRRGLLKRSRRFVDVGLRVWFRFEHTVLGREVPTSTRVGLGLGGTGMRVRGSGNAGSFRGPSLGLFRELAFPGRGRGVASGYLDSESHGIAFGSA